jgi:3-phosphoshikimate 1-carboxyvinyltransferase
MGAHFIIDKKNGTLTVKRSPPLQGMRIDINDFIDALPILAVVGCFAQGVTEIVNGAIARTKESDRIHSIAQELQKMGAQIEELPDGLRIHTSSLHGAEVRSYHDHRMALSLSIAALAAKGETTLLDVDCVKKTYPTFYQDFRNLGASISQ